MNWRLRSIIFVITLLFIYLLFPILIVPSSLPAINQAGTADAEIFQLEGETIPTFQDRFEDLRNRHRQGITIIINSF